MPERHRQTSEGEPRRIQVSADIHLHTAQSEPVNVLLVSFCERITTKVKQANKKIRKILKGNINIMAGITELNEALDELDSSFEELVTDIAAIPQAPDLQTAVDRVVAMAQSIRDSIPTPLVEGDPTTDEADDDEADEAEVMP